MERPAENSADLGRMTVSQCEAQFSKYMSDYDGSDHAVQAFANRIRVIVTRLLHSDQTIMTKALGQELSNILQRLSSDRSTPVGEILTPSAIDKVHALFIFAPQSTLSLKFDAFIKSDLAACCLFYPTLKRRPSGQPKTEYTITERSRPATTNTASAGPSILPARNGSLVRATSNRTYQPQSSPSSTAKVASPKRPAPAHDMASVVSSVSSGVLDNIPSQSPPALVTESTTQATLDAITATLDPGIPDEMVQAKAEILFDGLFPEGIPEYPNKNKGKRPAQDRSESTTDKPPAKRTRNPETQPKRGNKTKKSTVQPRVKKPNPKSNATARKSATKSKEVISNNKSDGSDAGDSDEDSMSSEEDDSEETATAERQPVSGEQLLEVDFHRLVPTSRHTEASMKYCPTYLNPTMDFVQRCH